jgi:hypothetical protein
MSHLPPHLRRRGPVSESGSGSGSDAASSPYSDCYPDEQSAAAGAAEVYGIYADGEGPSVSSSGSGEDAADGSLSECE